MRGWRRFCLLWGGSALIRRMHWSRATGTFVQHWDAIMRMFRQRGGCFRGRTDSELYVAVQVTASDAAPDLDRELPIPEDWSMLVEKAQAPPPPAEPLLQIQQSQQQQ